MLVAVPQINPYFAHVNALFLQPTPWCSRNCNGCYVKGFENINKVTTSQAELFKDILKIINRVSSEEGSSVPALLANQVTFALDRRPIDSKSVYMDNRQDITRQQRNTMMDLFHAFIEAKRMSIGGEFHITVHTLGDLKEYLWMDFDWPYTSLKIDMLSISHISEETSELNALRKYFTKSINWNLTVDPIMNMNTIKKTFPIIAEHVDSIYLVLHKPNTGQYLNLKALEVHQDFLRFIRTQPQKIQDKVYIDGCVVDSHRFLTTGYGCSSNVSRFQVWPDGSVTGCAYNQNKITPSATNIDELLKNLTQASKVYEFDQCKIPVHLDPNNKNIKKRSVSFLEIFE
jgi:hypothetical protein